MAPEDLRPLSVLSALVFFSCFVAARACLSDTKCGVTVSCEMFVTNVGLSPHAT